ncbi:hypothetical protein [Georgenia yuyongxinii]|uniref:DUF2569 family protein n=1 Tax=Georgenia yuyongxinii TaxID=2589797 RepID=A0A552WR46_9MICO|nr:hypothetical protein [Georgenia yuyongxinii]TRW45089.1 hypothetical protein FJ693_10825 [Georgenia yuyongxinii]
MTYQANAPVHREVEAPGALRTSRTLWLLSFVAGLVAVGFSWLNRDAGKQRLLETVTDLAPGRDAATLEALANVVFWGSLAAIALVVLLEALLMRTMMRRRGWPRVAAFFVLVVHATVTVLAEAYLAAPGGAGAAVRWPLLIQLGLAVVAWIVSLSPAASRWFRA